jgi:hypothetical protein
MRKMNKTLLLLAMSVISLSIGSHAKASAQIGETKSVEPSTETILPFSGIKDTDSIIKVSGDVYVHGKVTISNLLDINNSVIELDSDNNALAKTVRDVRNGEKLKTIKTFNQTRDRNSPPVNVMSLGYGGYSTADWSSGDYWHYTDYAFQASPVGIGKYLYFESYGDSMLAGDSEDWNATHDTGVGHGVWLDPKVGTEINSNIGSTLACWSWGPKAGSSYFVRNDRG